MTWSVAEIYALAVKAARGAGAPAGQAERFGHAAVAHLKAQRSADALQHALSALPEGPILTYPRVLDAAVGDVSLGGPGWISGVPRDDLLESYSEVLPFSARIVSEGVEALLLQVSLTEPRPRSVPTRIEAPEPLIAQMTALAENTFVPESESSRLSGAGAGLTDND